MTRGCSSATSEGGDLRTKAASGLYVLALVAAACADDGNATSAPGGGSELTSAEESELTAQEEEYLAAVAEIRDVVDETTEPLFDEVFSQAETSSTDSLLAAFAGAVASAISAEDAARDQVEALNPPARFETEHARLLSYLEERRELWVRQEQAAAALDLDDVERVGLDLASLERALLAEVSVEFGEAIALDDAAVPSLSILGEEELAYLDEVGLAFEEFARRAREFGRALERSYGSDELLLQALLDAGAGEAFAAVRDLAAEIDPPPVYEDAHDLLLEYLDETVRLDTLVAEAATNGDVVGFEVANVGLGLAAGRFALDAPPELGSVTSGLDTGELGPLDVPGDDYGAALAVELRRFRILALDAPVTSGVFPSLADETVMAALVEVEPTFIDLTREASTTLDGLDPPEDYKPGHDRLREYFDDLVQTRTLALDAATVGDAEKLRELGVLGELLAEGRAEVQLWCGARADVEDDPIWPIVEMMFMPFGPAATVAQLCPA